MLPSNRIRQAGASADEVAQLEAEFAAAPPAEQNTTEQFFASIAESGIAQWLEERRDAGHFEETPTSDPEEPSSGPETTLAEPQGAHTGDVAPANVSGGGGGGGSSATGTSGTGGSAASKPKE